MTNRVAFRMARFTLLASALLFVPFCRASRAAWMAMRILFLIPQSLVLAFPFAMIGAVDTIRCHEPLPPQVERAAVVKLGVLACC